MRLGLVLQLICFVLFAVVAARFVILSRRWAGRPLRYGDPHVRWERLNWAVNAAAALILVGLLFFLCGAVLADPCVDAHCLPPLRVCWCA